MLSAVHVPTLHKGKNTPVTCLITPRSCCCRPLCAEKSWVAGPRWWRKANSSTIMSRQTSLTDLHGNPPYSKKNTINSSHLSHLFSKMLYFHPIVLRMWNFKLMTSVIGFCVTVNWVESPNRAGNHIDGSWGAIKSSRATMSHWFFFGLSSNRALDTKVTKSRAMMEKGKQCWGSMTAGEEHKGGSTTAQGDKINRKQAVTCRNYTIRGLFGWPVFTQESRSQWGLPIQRNCNISLEDRAGSLNDWTSPSACWRHQLDMGMLHQTAFLWISSAKHLQMVQKCALRSDLYLDYVLECPFVRLKKAFSVTATFAG